MFYNCIKNAFVQNSRYTKLLPRAETQTTAVDERRPQQYCFTNENLTTPASKAITLSTSDKKRHLPFSDQSFSLAFSIPLESIILSSSVVNWTFKSAVLLFVLINSILTIAEPIFRIISYYTLISRKHIYNMH